MAKLTNKQKAINAIKSYTDEMNSNSGNTYSNVNSASDKHNALNAIRDYQKVMASSGKTAVQMDSSNNMNIRLMDIANTMHGIPNNTTANVLSRDLVNSVARDADNTVAENTRKYAQGNGNTYQQRQNDLSYDQRIAVANSENRKYAEQQKAINDKKYGHIDGDYISNADTVDENGIKHSSVSSALVRDVAEGYDKGTGNNALLASEQYWKEEPARREIKKQNDVNSIMKYASEYNDAVKDGSAGQFMPDNDTVLNVVGDAEDLNMMTDGERDTLSFVIGKYGQKEANKYLNALRDRLDARITESNYADVQRMAEEHPIAYGVPANTLYGIASGASGLLAEGKSFLTDRKLESSDPLLRSTAMQEAATIGTQNGIKRSLGIEEGSQSAMVSDFLVGTVLSAINSASTALAMPEVAVLTLFSGNAMGSSLYDASQNNNISQKNAMYNALADGVAESFFEMFSVESLKAFQMSDGNTLRDLISNIGKQFVTEGSEEVFTEISNILADIFINGENSEYGYMYNQLVNNGTDEKSALSSVVAEALKNIGLAGLAGGISGGISGGAVALNNAVGMVSDYIGNVDRVESNVRDYDPGNGYSSYYDEMASTIDDSTAEGSRLASVAREYADRLANGRDVSTRENVKFDNDVSDFIKNRSESIEAENENAETRTIIDDLAKRYEENGAKAYKDNMYASNMPMDAYSTAFNALYTANRNAINESNSETVSTLLREADNNPYVKLLPASVRENIINAAMLDTRSAVERINDAKRYAPGIAPESKNNANISDAEKNAIDELGKLTGLTIAFRDDTTTKTRSGKVIRSGAFVDVKTGKVVLNVNGAVNDFAHETVHMIKEYAPKEYEELKNIIAEAIASDGGSSAFRSMIERKMEAYKDVTSVQTEQDAIEEITADGMAILGDQDIINEIARRNKTLAEKIRNFVSKILDCLRTLFSRNKHNAASLSLKKNIDFCEKALDAWTRGIETVRSSVTVEGITEADGIVIDGSEKDNEFKHSLDYDSELAEEMKVNTASFFSGAGTIEFAIRNVIRHEFAVENNAKVAAVYKANNGKNIYIDDVRKVDISKHSGSVEYFHASPVCKNFSNASNTDVETPLDIMTAKATAEAINKLMPKVVTVENVARYKNSESVKIIEDALSDNGYTFDKAVYRASDYGGATIRQRMFIRAVKDGVLPTVEKKAPTSWYSVVSDIIDDLPDSNLSNYMTERLTASGIDINNIDQPVFILGGNKSGKLTFAYADSPAPTLLAKSTEARIIMPDGRVLRATPRVMARIQGLPDSFNLMESEEGITNAYKVVGNGVPVQLTQAVVGSLLEENIVNKRNERIISGDEITVIDDGDNSVKFSIEQVAKGMDWQIAVNDEGSPYKIIDKSGNEITSKSITSDVVRNTPYGMLIDVAVKENAMSEESASSVRNTIAEICGKIVDYKDQAMVWEVFGNSMFSSFKNNSDKQYRTTVDYGTICSKTQAIIDVMSASMVKLRRGLTRREIIDVYRNTTNNGLSVPCPVCYVFSRWMGVPSLLETIRSGQTRFGENATEKEVNDYITGIELKYGGKDGITKRKQNLQNKVKSLEDSIRKNSSDKNAVNKIADETETIYKELSDVEIYNWVTQVRCATDSKRNPIRNNGKVSLDKNYKDVPLDILFDLNRTGEFAKNYPKTWLYRTTRGAGMGKAIMPYSGAGLGDAIKGAGISNVKKYADNKNPIYLMDEAKTSKDIRGAISRMRSQNLIGGQRLQSTSDFRAEWGLDYYCTALELSAIKAKVQEYTKVLEAVDFFASCGYELNISIMGKGDGYSYDKNGNPVLTENDFSSVTGADFAEALKFVKKYDNVQMILVGLNDTHINLALNDDRIGFVIPWHSSGSSENVLSQLMDANRETLRNGQDYSDVQEDKVIEYNDVSVKKHKESMRKLRKDIVTGKLRKGGKNIDLTNEQMRLLDENPYLKDLYNRFYLDKNAEEFGVKLSASQSEKIFPYEYWDKSLNASDAYINGRRFIEYCNSLGLKPRFSGEKGKDGNVFGDFTKNSGYWKLLIDRPMYNNDGTYHEPSFVNVGNVKINDIPISVESNEYKDMRKKQNAVLDSLKAIDGSVYNETLEYYESQDDENLKLSIPENEIEENENYSSVPFENMEDLRNATVSIASLNENLENEYGKIAAHKVSDGIIDKVAGKILKKYSSDYDIGNLRKAMRTMYDYMSNKQEFNAREIAKLAQDYGREIINQATDLDTTMRDEYPNLKNDIKGYRISLSESEKSDIASYYGSYNDFRKGVFGSLTIVNKDGTSVDKVYSKLSKMYPELFPDNIINTSDELARLIEVSDSLKPVSRYITETMSGVDIEEMSYIIGQEILAGYFDTQSDKSFANKLEKAKDAIKKQANEKFIQAKRDLAKIYDEKTLELRKAYDNIVLLNAHYEDMQRKAKLRRDDSEARNRLLKTARRLAGKKLTPELASIRDELLNDLDVYSRGLRSDTIRRLEQLRSDAMHQAEVDEDYRTLYYDTARRSFDRLQMKHINDMSMDEVLELTQALIDLEHHQQTFNKTLSDNLGEMVATLGRKIVRQQNDVKGIDVSRRLAKSIGTYNLYMLNPTRAMQMLDGYDPDGVLTALGKALNDGQTKSKMFEMLAKKKLEASLSDDLKRSISKADIEITGRDGRKYLISKGMRMSLYLHSKNRQNMKHIYEGGIKIPDANAYNAGRYRDADSLGKIVKISPTELKQITSAMTEDEIRFANTVMDFLNNDTKKAINEVSNVINGYDKAIVDNYFPIRSDLNFTKSDITGLINDATIEGMGMLKERQNNAANPIMLEDVARVVDRQITNTARYYGLAIPVRDYNKVMNYTSTGYANSVKNSIDKKWGSAGATYLKNMLSDIQTGGRPSNGMIGELFDVLKGKYAGSVLNMNLGVAMKQTASAPFASIVLDGKSVAKAFTANSFSEADRKYMDSITPLGWTRRNGMSGTEIGEVYKQRSIVDNNPLLSKVRDVTNWIQIVDVWTTERLFFATEYYVRDHYPSLKVRGSEYNAKVAELYNDVLQRTQPSYDVMQRNEFLRSSDTITKVLSAFKTQTFNMGGEILDAYGRWSASKSLVKNGKMTEKQAKDAADQFGKTLAYTIVSQGMLAGLSCLANMILHRMKSYRDDNGEVTAESVIGKIFKDFATSFAGLAFFGSEMQSALLYITGAEKWYGISVPAVETINDIVSNLGSWKNAVASYDPKKPDTLKNITNKSWSLAKAISTAFGIPANNIYNLFNAVNLWTQDYVNDNMFSFESGTGLLDDTSVTKKQMTNRLASSIASNDYDKYIKTYNNLVNTLGEKKAQEALTSTIKSDEYMIELSKSWESYYNGSKNSIIEEAKKHYGNMSKTESMNKAIESAISSVMKKAKSEAKSDT